MEGDRFASLGQHLTALLTSRAESNGRLGAEMQLKTTARDGHATGQKPQPCLAGGREMETKEASNTTTVKARNKTMNRKKQETKKQQEAPQKVPLTQT